MTRDDILTDLFNNSAINTAIRFHARGKEMDFEKELKSCTFVCLCEMEASLIEDLYEDRELIPFVCGVIKNLSSFTNDKNAVRPIIDYVPNRVNNDVMLPSGEHAYLMDMLVDGSFDTLSITNKEDSIAIIQHAVSRLSQYERNMWDAYMKYDTMLEACEAIPVDIRYGRRLLMQAKRKIRKHVGLD